MLIYAAIYKVVDIMFLLNYSRGIKMEYLQSSRNYVLIKRYHPRFKTLIYKVVEIMFLLNILFLYDFLLSTK